jgi:hypothetical protein
MSSYQKPEVKLFLKLERGFGSGPHSTRRELQSLRILGYTQIERRLEPYPHLSGHCSRKNFQGLLQSAPVIRPFIRRWTVDFQA